MYGDEQLKIMAILNSGKTFANGEQLTADKLNQVIEFEKKYGESTRTIAWKKWCTDINYRRREWQFRMGVAEYAKHNAHKAFNIR